MDARHQSGEPRRVARRIADQYDEAARTRQLEEGLQLDGGKERRAGSRFTPGRWPGVSRADRVAADPGAMPRGDGTLLRASDEIHDAVRDQIFFVAHGAPDEPES